MEENLKQLLLKDLCARVSSGVICNYEGVMPLRAGRAKSYDKLTGITLYSEHTVLEFGPHKAILGDSIKPYLRPMSSMTEGEKEELLNLLFDEDAKYFYIDEEGIIDGKHTDLMKEGLNEVLFCPRNVELYSNFLNSHFLDWRGLIPLGLALEATAEMYDIK